MASVPARQRAEAEPRRKAAARVLFPCSSFTWTAVQSRMRTGVSSSPFALAIAAWRLVAALSLLTVAAQAETRVFAPDRVLVKYRSASAPGDVAVTRIDAERAAVRQTLGVVSAKRFAGDAKLELWTIKSGASVAETLRALQGNPLVEFAEPDFVVSIDSAAPSDPYFADGSLWGLRNSGQNGGRAGADIGAIDGWDVRTSATMPDGKPVIVAVIDTGIRRTHEDLAANMWENRGEVAGNGVDDDGNGYIDDRWGLNAITYAAEHRRAGDPMDDHGHGTHVSGTIGAVANNGRGAVGVAWTVRLMAVKFLDSGGGGYTSDAVEAVDYARANGATVMSNSWGGGGFSQALLEAIQRANDAGIVFVAAAGNAGSDTDAAPSYPSCYEVPNVVSVAASDRWDGLAYFSNFGRRTVDLAAPGQDILSSWNSSDTAYSQLSGTSMATPHVSGAMALLRAEFPDDAPVWQINRLLHSVRPVPAMAATASGGILNLSGALRCTDTSPMNNARSAATPLAVNASVSGSNEGANTEPGEPAHAAYGTGASVWYRITPTRGGEVTLRLRGASEFYPVFAVYLAIDSNGLVPLAHGDVDHPVSCRMEAGRSYLIAVDGTNRVTGSFFLHAQQPPANDDFERGFVLTGAEGELDMSVAGATVQPGEPGAGDPTAAITNTVWFQWTAPATGRYTFRPAFQAAAWDWGRPAVYTGATLDALTRVHSSAFISYGFISSKLVFSAPFQFDAVGGTTYRLQIAAIAALANLHLYWAPAPPNDDWDTAEHLTGEGGSIAGNSRGALPKSFLGAPPEFGGGEKDVWFRWTAPRTGRVVFTTAGTAWDTTLEVFTGASETELEPVLGNDDIAETRQSSVSFYALAGADYTIRLNGYYASAFSPHLETPSGPYTLTWAMPQAPHDADGDGYSDLLVRDSGTNAVGLLLLTGTYRTGTLRLSGLPSGATAVCMADFNGDHQADLVLRNTTSGTYSIAYLNGGTVATTALLAGVPIGAEVIDAADFSGDGRADLVVADPLTRAYGICRWQAPNDFTYAMLGGLPADCTLAAVGDFDANGQPDLAWQNGVTGERTIALLDGYRSTAILSLGFYTPAETIVTTGDLNGDGIADLVHVNRTTGATGVWFISAGGIMGNAALDVSTAGWVLAATPQGAPGFLQHPESQTVEEGAPATFEVHVSSAPSATLTWQVTTDSGLHWAPVLNSAIYSGADQSSLSVGPVLREMDGFSYRCIATSAVGTVISAPAVLHVSGRTTSALDKRAGTSNSDASTAYAPDRVIVKFAPTAISGGGSNQAGMAVGLRNALGATMVRRFSGDAATELWRLPSGIAVEDALSILRAEPAVAFAEPDYAVAIRTVTPPNDPAFTDGTLWGLNNTGQNRGVSGADIRALEGWAIRHTAVRADGRPIIVAVIDTGIRRTHQDLAASMWENAGEIADNGVDDDHNGYIDDRWGLNAITYAGAGSSAGDPNDDYGHGTHVAGTIGAVSNNGAGVVGVAWNVKLMAVKFMDSTGSGWISDAVEAVDYARANGATVLNNSWGGGGFSQAMLEAIQRADSAGVIFVAAAGNYTLNLDRTEFFPASYAEDNVVAVAATNRSDELASFSNFGLRSVGLAAPGEAVYSTYFQSDSSYVEMSGTSMAAPHVSGAIALMQAQFPEDLPAALITRVVRSVRPVAALKAKTAGGGVLCLPQALKADDTSPLNNDLSGAVRIEVNGSRRGSNRGATKEPNEPAHGGNAGGASVWFKFVSEQAGLLTLTVSGQSPFLPTFGLYLIAPDGAFISAAGAGSGGGASSATVFVQAGRTYFLAVDGFAGAAGSFTITTKLPPPHDAFAAAAPLSGLRGGTSGWADGGTREAGEPSPVAVEWGSVVQYPGGASVWWSWTPPNSGTYTFLAMCGGLAGKPLLNFYTGGSVDHLTRVETVEELWGLNSLYLRFLRVTVTGGVPYHLQLDAATGGGMGYVRLDWAPTPPNDDFVAAQVLTGESGTVSGDTRGATAALVPPYACPFGNGGADVWFSWTAPRSEMVEFTTEGTAWDTTLDVYTGTTESALALATTNNDAAATPGPSRAGLFVSAGTRYAIRLNGFTNGSGPHYLETPSGPFEFRWRMRQQAHDLDGNGWPDLLARTPADGGRGVVLLLDAALGGPLTVSGIPADREIVGIADMNGDGYSDLLLQNPETGAVSYAAIEGITASAAIPINGVLSGQEVVGAGDFDHDGTPDLLVQDYRTGAAGIWLCRSGVATVYVALGDVALPWQIAALGDLDGDGSVDVFRQNRDTGEIVVLQMSGTSVRAVTTVDSGDAAWTLVGTEDLDANGVADLLVQNRSTDAAEVWYVVGGTVQRKAPLPGVVPGIKLGPARRKAPEFYRLLSDQFAMVGQTAVFEAAIDGIPKPACRWQISTDAGTTWADLADGGPYSGAASPTLRVAPVTFAMRGHEFRCVASNAVASGVHSSRAKLLATPPAADFNQDGQEDLVWQNWQTGQRLVWLMAGLKPTGSPVDLGVVTTDWLIVGTGDFNADGHADLVWDNTVTGQCGVWLMDRTTAPNTFTSIGTTTTDWRIAAVGDFDGDGRPDLVWQNLTTGERGFWLLNGTVLKSGFVSLGTMSLDWNIVGAGDFTGDNRADLVWQNRVSGAVMVWPMANTARLGDAFDIEAVSTDWLVAGVRDLDHDRKADLIWQNAVTGRRGAWLMDGGTRRGGFVDLGTLSTDWASGGTGPMPDVLPSIVTHPQDVSVQAGTVVVLTVDAVGRNLHYQWHKDGAPIAGATGPSLRLAPVEWPATGSYTVEISSTVGSIMSRPAALKVRSRIYNDLDGDGKSDLIWQSIETGERAVSLASHGHPWEPYTFRSIDTLPVDWSIAGSGDFDGDRKTDFVLENTADGRRAIWLMDGLVPRGDLVLLDSAGVDWRIVGTGDFNGDGKTDLVWQNTTSSEVGLWLMDGTQRSSAFISIATSDRKQLVCGAGDFNGDGKPDLVLQEQTYQYTATIWFMDGIRRSGEQRAITDLWTSIAGTGDFDADGTADLILQNLDSSYRSIRNLATNEWYYVPEMNSDWRVGQSGLPHVVAPAIVVQPTPATFMTGQSVSLWMRVTGTGPFKAEIRRGGEVVTPSYFACYPSETGLVWYCTFSPVGAGHAGVYTIKLSNRAGSVVSDEVTLKGHAGQVGDLDSNSAPDLIWQNTTTGQRIFWSMTGMAPAGSSVELGVIPPEWRIAAVVDQDRDWARDLVWQNSVTGEYGIWRMSGTARVGDFVSMGTKPTQWRLAADADFDGDGGADLLWHNTYTGEWGVQLMDAMTPRGDFASKGVVSPVWGLAGAGDFNDDAWMDLVWQNAATGERQIWLMNGTAVRQVVSLGVVSTDWTIAWIADFDGDFYSDLVWQNRTDGQCGFWKMKGVTPAGGFTYLTTRPTEWVLAGNAERRSVLPPTIGALPQDLAIVAGEGITLRVTAAGAGPLAYQWAKDGRDIPGATAEVYVLGRAEWPAAGSYTVRVSNAAGVVSSAAVTVRVRPRVTADLDADGRPDVIWQNEATGQRALWLMDGARQKGSYVDLGTVPAQWRMAATADFNGDGKNDLVWENRATGQRGFWLMNGTALQGDLVPLITVHPEWTIAGAGDFNGDGDPDLVLQNTRAGQCGFWLMHGTAISGAFVPLYTAGVEWNIAGVGDFNDDGKPDLVLENTLTGERGFRLLNGTTLDGNFVSLGIISTDWRIASAADYNGDGQTDIAWQNSTSGRRGFWLMRGTSLNSDFVDLTVLPAEWSMNGADWPGRVGSAPDDLDGDGRSDVIWQNVLTGQRVLWLLDGPRQKGSYVDLGTIQPAWRMAAIGDFTGDGMNDLVWENRSTGQRGFWKMSGTRLEGDFVPLITVEPEWTVAGSGDFNGDGHADLVLQNTRTGVRGFWLMHGTAISGNFVPLYTVGVEWNIAGVGDYNADGKTDLVLENLATGQRGFWLLNGTTILGDYVPLATVATEWRIAGSGDYNGDGRPDLAWQNLTTGRRGFWMMNRTSLIGDFVDLTVLPTEWTMNGGSR